MFKLFGGCKHKNVDMEGAVLADGRIEIIASCLDCDKILSQKQFSMNEANWINIGKIKGYINSTSTHNKPDFDNARNSWWNVLGIPKNSTKDEINNAWKRLSKKYHPDIPGGSVKKMSEINVAKDTGLKYASN